MSELPPNSFGEREKRRIAAEAEKREEERAKSHLTILEKQAAQADDDRKNEERHKEVERETWRQQGVVAAGQLQAARRLNTVTIVAAAFAIVSAIGVIWSVIEARRATTEANRAWISVPMIMSVNNSHEGGFPERFQLLIVNTGRAPAAGAVWHIHPISIPYIDYDGVPIETPNDTCRGLEPDLNHGVVIFPPSGTNFWIPLEFGGSPQVRKSLEYAKSRTATLLVQGCVAYITFGVTRTSAFTFFLRDAPGTNGEPWRFNSAAYGNKAD